MTYKGLQAASPERYKDILGPRGTLRIDPLMKLSAKFARQESEQARVARIARRRIPLERADAIRRMLRLSETESRGSEQRPVANGADSVVCPECQRRFALPMHLGRHKKRKHDAGAIT